MKPVDPSLDELMWLIAEQSDPAATESFCRRYPAQKEEVLRRMNLVRGLRANQCRHAAPTPPPFQVRKAIWNPIPVLALLAFGVATYSTTRLILSRNEGPAASSVTTPIEAPRVQPRSVGEPRPMANQNPEEQAQPEPDQTPPPPVEPMDRTVSLKVTEGSLLQTLNEISQQSGVSFQLAPGLNDMPITLEAENQSVKDVLTRISIDLNISFLEQNPGEVLLLPARNQNPP